MTSLTFKSWSVSSIFTASQPHFNHVQSISCSWLGGKHCPPQVKLVENWAPGASPCWTSVRTGQTSRRNLYMPFLSYIGKVPPCSNWPPIFDMKNLNGFKFMWHTKWILIIGDVPSRELTYPTLGKGKSSSKSHFLGDMLVPWRVLSKQQCSKFPKPAEAAASIPNMIRVQIGPHPDELATTRSNLSLYTLSTIT